MPRLPQLIRQLTGRRSLAMIIVLVLLVVGGVFLALGPAASPAPPRIEEVRLPGAGTPPADLDATLYLPATTSGPAPVALVAHGFGGSKVSVDADARELANRGLVVLAWSARGFGRSTGQIALNSPDAEVADASRLLDWLATRPEVRLDGPGDPRVGVTGGSYGGALALLLAGHDRRVDAVAPVITYNDLSQALFPNTASTASVPSTTPAQGVFGPQGVFKQGWAGVFFAAGLGPASGPRTGAASAPPVPSTGAPATCGRFVPVVCQAYTEAATTGLPSPASVDLLRRSSPTTVAGQITAPTLIVQGEQDTLFGLDQADATARQIAARGTTVRTVWFAGGHDGMPPGPSVNAEVGAWFDYHLAGTGPDPGTGFSYAVDSGVRTANSSTRTGRTVTAPTYPGLVGGPGVEGDSVQRDPVVLRGDPQPVVNPPGGSPAAITSVPGVSGALGNTAGRLAALTSELPGQSAIFTSDPLEAQLLVAGSAQLRFTVGRLPGQPAGPEAVLFGKLYELGPDGRRTLLGGAVAPMRVAVAADGRPTDVTVTLPGVVAPIEAGNRLMVAISTTDQGFVGAKGPAVWQIGLIPDTAGATAVSVPVVPGQSATVNTVPTGPAIGIAAIVAAAVAAWTGGYLVRRRRDRSAEPDPAGLAEGPPPLVVDELAKTYPGGLVAVDGVSFSVQSGMVLGLLGPNGAGKTTVLRMLMGLIRPSAGGLTAFGQPIYAGAPVLSRVGSFVEGPGFLPHLSGSDNLRLYWAATGRPTDDANFAEVLRIADLGTAIDRRVRTYSHGMRQRLAIAQAMLGLPDLLVLDEPTNGLDPPQIHAMRDVLRNYASTGRTVLVSSHLLAEVEQTCTHVVVMHHGRVVADGTVAEIIAGGGGASFAVDSAQRAAEVLRSLAGVSAVTFSGTQSDGPDDDVVHANLNGLPRASAVDALVRAGVAVSSAGPRRRLEDAFLQLVGEDRA